MKIRALPFSDQNAFEVAKYLIEEFYGAYTEHFPPPNPKRVWLHVADHMKRGVVYILEHDGKILGSISGAPTQFWWSDAGYVSDGWFFVSPAARKSRAGVLLLEQLAKWAKARDLPLAIGVTTGDDLARKTKFFQRRGFEYVGGFFLRGHK